MSLLGDQIPKVQHCMDMLGWHAYMRVLAHALAAGLVLERPFNEDA